MTNYNDPMMNSTDLKIEQAFKEKALQLTTMLYQVGFTQIPEYLTNEYMMYQTKLDKLIPGRSAQLLDEAEREVKALYERPEKPEDFVLHKLELRAKRLNGEIDTYSFGNYDAPKALKRSFTRTMMAIDSIEPKRSEALLEEFQEVRRRHVKKVLNDYSKNTNNNFNI